MLLLRRDDIRAVFSMRDAIEAALSESYVSAPTLRYERKS